MAPWIAFWSSSIVDVSDDPDPYLYPGPTGSPARFRTPEWLGDDLIDEGQLATYLRLMILPHFKFPENVDVDVPLLLPPAAVTAIFSLLSRSAAPDTVLAGPPPLLPPPTLACFWDESFSYRGFTFFRYLRMTSFADAVVFLADPPSDLARGGGGSFLKILEREK